MAELVSGSLKGKKDLNTCQPEDAILSYIFSCADGRSCDLQLSGDAARSQDWEPGGTLQLYSPSSLRALASVPHWLSSTGNQKARKFCVVY